MTNIKPGQIWEIKNTIRMWNLRTTFKLGTKILVLKQTFNNNSWYDIWVDGKVCTVPANWFSDHLRII